MVLTGKKVIVVGLGKSGLAVAAFALRKGAEVYACDNADLAMNQTLRDLAGGGVEVLLGGMPEQEVLNAADQVILSPGVPHTKPEFLRAAANGTEVIGELEFAARFIYTPIIAITGTNGKTTTTELCAAMLRAAGYQVFVGGNIGTPLIEYAMTAQECDVCVVEVSSFQLDTIVRFRPHIAVILNVTPDHLDRYEGDLHKYYLAKMRIFENQTAEDYAVLNVNDEDLREIEPALDAHTLWLGDLQKYAGVWSFPGAQLPAQDRLHITLDDQKISLDLSEFKLLGPHNRENLAAAALAALAFGVKPHAIEAALADFAVAPHRVALVGEKEGVRFIDDSKATNIDAVARALDCFEEACVLIMGGLDKGCEFNDLRPAVAAKVKAVVAIGAAKAKLVNTFGDLVPVIIAASMPEAVVKAYDLAKPDGCVLLSPACASFDMFESYAHRGEMFIEAFKALQV